MASTSGNQKTTFEDTANTQADRDVVQAPCLRGEIAEVLDAATQPALVVLPQAASPVWNVFDVCEGSPTRVWEPEVEHRRTKSDGAEGALLVALAGAVVPQVHRQEHVGLARIEGDKHKDSVRTGLVLQPLHVYPVRNGKLGEDTTEQNV